MANKPVPIVCESAACGVVLGRDPHTVGCSVARMERAQLAAADAVSEMNSAVAAWPAFNSAHEGFAVLYEEVDELWEHVRTNQKRRDPVAMRKEALQVAAMALRFAVDCCTEEACRK